MDLKELGSRLKTERERQELTVEQIMELTKISRVNVYAIEDGNKKELPHPVYAKGFIKNYAKVLGLNSEEIGEEFSSIYAIEGDSEQNSEDSYENNNSIQNDYSATAKKSSASSIVMILILVAVLAGFVYYLNNNSLLDFGSTKHSESIENDSTIETTPAEIVKEDEVVTEQPVEAVVETPVVEEEVKPEEIVTAPEQEELPVVATMPAINTVVITAKPGEACWLEATVDDERSEYVIQEKESLSLSYNKNLKIKFGNGGGVDVTFDGKPFVFNSAKGKIKVVEFPVSE